MNNSVKFHQNRRGTLTLGSKIVLNFIGTTATAVEGKAKVDDDPICDVYDAVINDYRMRQ